MWDAYHVFVHLFFLIDVGDVTVARSIQIIGRFERRMGSKSSLLVLPIRDARGAAVAGSGMARVH